jgi:hypothetical protein
MSILGKTYTIVNISPKNQHNKKPQFKPRECPFLKHSIACGKPQNAKSTEPIHPIISTLI